MGWSGVEEKKAYLHDAHTGVILVDKLIGGCLHDPVRQTGRTSGEVADCSITGGSKVLEN